MAGSLTGHAELPPGFTAVSSLTPGNGDYVLAIDSNSGRLALLSSQASGLGLTAVYVTDHATAACLDVATGKIYAIAGSHVVSYSLPR